MTDQFKKLIRNRIDSIEEIGKLNPKVIAEGKFDTAYSNLLSAMRSQFEIALMHWRRGDSPLAAFQATLMTAEAVVAWARTWNLSEERIGTGPELALLPVYAAFLTNGRANVPTGWISLIRRVQGNEAADVALDFHVLDALEGKSWRDGVDEALARLAKKKRQSLAVDTYRTYFALLEARGVIPTFTENHALAHWRFPMDMMRHG